MVQGGVLLIAAGLVVAGCGGSDNALEGGDERATASTTVAGATSTTTVDQAVIAGYRAYWDLFFATVMHPDDRSWETKLPQVITGNELARLRQYFAGFQLTGHVVRGDWEVMARVVGVDGSKATLSDCLLDLTGEYDPKTGQRFDQEERRRFLLEARLVLEDAVWKVSDIKKVGEPGCTAP